MPTAEELIEIVIRAAPRLIAVGVTSIQLDGVSVTLGKPEPQPAADLKPQQPPIRHSVNPLRDPSTYPAGRVPGYTRDKA